jgi:F420H(2)-dependent quinone reductase
MTLHLISAPGPSGRIVRTRDTTEPNVRFHRQPYRTLVRPTVKMLARLHLGLLRASRGGVGRQLFGGRLVLLTTVGRRSGRERTTPLAYMRHGESLVVAASCGGSDRIPDWWLNLQRQPRAVIDMAGVKRAVYAHRAESDMLSQLAPQFEEHFPQMHFYQRMARREIPLIVLQPTHELSTNARPPRRRRENLAVGDAQWCVQS